MGNCAGQKDPGKSAKSGAVKGKPSSQPHAPISDRSPRPTSLTSSTDPPLDVWEAAKEGRVDDVREGIRRGIGIRAANIDGQMLVHVAARYGHIPLLLALSEHPKFDIEAANTKGSTPLVFALEHDQRLTAQWLVDRGASLAATAVHLGGRTAFILAYELSPIFAFKLVSSQSAFEPPPHYRSAMVSPVDHVSPAPSPSLPALPPAPAATSPRLSIAVPAMTVTTTITSTTSATSSDAQQQQQQQRPHALTARAGGVGGGGGDQLRAPRPMTALNVSASQLFGNPTLQPFALPSLLTNPMHESLSTSSLPLSTARPHSLSVSHPLGLPSLSMSMSMSMSSSLSSALSAVPLDASSANVSDYLPYLTEPHRHHVCTTFYVSKLADIVATVLPVCANVRLLHEPTSLANLDASSLEHLSSALITQTFGGSVVPSQQPVWIAPSLLSHESSVFQLEPADMVEFASKAERLCQALKKFRAGNPAELRFFAAEFTNLLWMSLGRSLQPTQPHLALIIKVYVSALKLINVAEGVNPDELSESQFLWAANMCYFHTFEICSYFVSAMLFTETSSERFELSLYLANLTKGYIFSNFRLWRERASKSPQQAKVQLFSQNALKQIVVVIKQFLHCSLGGQLPDALVSLLKQVGDPYKDTLDRCLAAATRNFDLATAAESQLDTQLMRDAGELFRHIQALHTPIARGSPLDTFDLLILIVKLSKRLVASSLMVSFETPRLSDRIVEQIHQTCVIIELLSSLFLLQETISLDTLDTMIRSTLTFLMNLCLSLCYMGQGPIFKSWLFWKKQM